MEMIYFNTIKFLKIKKINQKYLNFYYNKKNIILKQKYWTNK